MDCESVFVHALPVPLQVMFSVVLAASIPRLCHKARVVRNKEADVFMVKEKFKVKP